MTVVTHYKRKPAKRSMRKKILIASGLLLVAAIIFLKFYMASWLLDYVNNVLADMHGYTGHAESIDIALLDGAYTINGLSIRKKTNKIPVPFFSADTIAFTVDWHALFEKRILAKAELFRPVLNFAVSGDNKQYGSEQDWTKVVKDLMPIDLNRLTLIDGKITYKDFSTEPKVDIDVHDINGHIDNLRNADAAGTSLPSPVDFSALSLGNGKVRVRGRVNILRPFPDIDLDGALEKASLPALNSFPEAYAAFSFRRGTLDFYVHLKVINDQVSGYIKPIGTDLSVDIFKSSNPIVVVWNAIVAGVAEILTNHEKDQFATRASLDGNLDTISPDVWEALAGIFRNAFIEAFDKGFRDLQPPASVPNKPVTQ